LINNIVDLSSLIAKFGKNIVSLKLKMLWL